MPLFVSTRFTSSFLKIQSWMHRKVINQKYLQPLLDFFNDTVFRYFRVIFLWFHHLSFHTFWLQTRAWFWRKLDYKFLKLSISKNFYHLSYVSGRYYMSLILLTFSQKFFLTIIFCFHFFLYRDNTISSHLLCFKLGWIT